MINKTLATAAQTIPVSWGIQVALNGTPDLLLLDAESEVSGDDAGERMNQAVMNYKLRESMDRFHGQFGGHGAS